MDRWAILLLIVSINPGETLELPPNQHKMKNLGYGLKYPRKENILGQ